MGEQSFNLSDVPELCRATHRLTSQALTPAEVLEKYKAGEIPLEAAEALMEAGGAPLTLKFFPRGGIGLCGLQRMPVTLYPSQWRRVLAALASMANVLNEHESDLIAQGKAFARLDSTTQERVSKACSDFHASKRG